MMNPTAFDPAKEDVFPGGITAKPGGRGREGKGTPEEDAPVIDVQGLTVSFGGRERALRAVEDLSFTIRRGECLGLVGESGSGKSVTALAIMGLVAAPAGRVEGGRILFREPGPQKESPVDEVVDLLRLPPRLLRRIRGDRIAMIFQNPAAALNPFLSIAEQMMETLAAHRRISRRKALGEAAARLREMGIPDAEHRIHDYPHRFSGGMCQRILIATALLLDPALLIADEPTTALDVTIQAQILAILGRTRSRLKTSMLLITHDLGVVAEQADRVLVIYAGRMVEMGATETLFDRPAHPYTAALRRSLPSILAPAGMRIPSLPGSLPHHRERWKACAFAPRCDRARERCRLERPPPAEVGHAHRAACWYPLEP